MCGIVGVLSLYKKTINLKYLKPMADKISHRGPDDAGYLCLNSGTLNRNKTFYKYFTEKQFKNKNNPLPEIESNSFKRELFSQNFDLYMGHRRLSILDVSYAGHQPMSDSSKNIWISYNGEIYNFKQLKSKLKKFGHVFKSNCDTEVIIYAYKQWGIDCIKKFNGMFAFSLYDNLKKKFYLCRDRYGIKPIYYHFTEDKTLVYASEVKSLLEYKDIQTEINKSSLIEYFTFQNFFTNNTLHKNIHILEAGNYIEINLQSKKIKHRQYWDFNFSKTEIIKDEREYKEELSRLFSRAVERQLISDVPVGSYLSGGMDSGSISAIASNVLKKSNIILKTFTIGFDLTSASGIELSFDEREKAKYMSNKFKTDHYTKVLRSGDMERSLPKIAYHLDEPRIGQSYPNYYAAELASKHVKVVLSGAGGDELFAGYPWRYYRATNNKNFNEYIDKYYLFWQRLVPNKYINKIFSPIIKDVKNVWTRDIFKDVFKDYSLARTPEEYINHSLYFEAKTFLHSLLVVEDKLSMSHSLETRIPFLDNDLVDFSQKIPVKYKLNDFNKVDKIDENEISKIIKTNNGKTILRKVMKKHLSEKIANATKQGFSAPDKSWFKGESMIFVKDQLLNKKAKIYKYLDRNIVKKLISEHLDGKTNRRLFIWSLLNFEEWIRINEK